MTFIRQCDKCGEKMIIADVWELQQIRLGGNYFDLCKDCTEAVIHFIIGVKE